MANEVDNTEEAVETDLAPHNIVDKVAFGRRLRAQRVLMGFDRVGQLTDVLRSRYGVDVSDRTIYAIERGEQMPHIDFLLGVMAALEVNFTYFSASVRHDVWQDILTRAPR
jgi:transcriptional regulator with XRE-family HTH domain